jgi:hypothetical protein
MEMVMPDASVLESVEFRCGRNGCPRIQGYPETIDWVWKSNICLIQPLGWQRYRFGDDEDAYFFHERHIGPAQIHLLIELYSAQCVPVIAGRSVNALKRGTRVKRNNHNQRRVRVRPAFPGYDPIVILPDYENSNGRRRGYLFARGITYFIVYGLVKRDPRFDWGLLLKRPTDPGRIIQP